MSYNVQDWRRLGQVIGQCAALTPAPNVVKRKPCRGRKPEHGFAKPKNAEQAFLG